MGYLNWVIYLIFYCSTIIALNGDRSLGILGVLLSNPIVGPGFIILGFIVCTIPFIRDIRQYLRDKKL